MIRTTFRRGLAMGLLGGAVLTAVRTLQGRRASPQPVTSPAPAWDPIPDAAPVVVPEPAADVQVAPGPDPQPARPQASQAVNVLQEGPAPEQPAAAAPTKAAPKKAPAKKAAKKPVKKPESAALAPWVEPTEGECPGTHPIKGKLTSKIFHVPGGFNYPRTKPDRCYVDAAAAEADGLRLSKR